MRAAPIVRSFEENTATELCARRRGGCPLRQSEKRFNKLISKRWFRVEQCFGSIKRLFGPARARYFGLAKAHAQLAMAAIGQKLLKAANKITLNPQTPAIV